MGTTATSVYNTSYTAFLGIPYAEPPTGELRFQAPGPAAAWEGVLNATQCGSDCVQSTGTGCEDCLYLNVYVPGTPAEAAALPALFWIHGGGCGSGSGSDQQYGPDFIVSYGVILVTINYRHGPLGFLNTGDEVVPGNAGLKDQQLALTWVQRNVASFGGDPDLVTPFGQSAGGMAVSFHLVSPLSAGMKEHANKVCGVGQRTCPQPYAVDNNLPVKNLKESHSSASPCDLGAVRQFDSQLHADASQLRTCTRQGRRAHGLLEREHRTAAVYRRPARAENRVLGCICFNKNKTSLRKRSYKTN
ncbi:venom carboxylesterase-6-like [Schistocerca cancellata]|uniref:venom carboxylesterase-6-like n=1 Tax=Schistocerca cancellata TaxID=274614 RepID=UPI002117CB15|nr:venom carboxylesterase-6-like [Schistocerca cancellata]